MLPGVTCHRVEGVLAESLVVLGIELKGLVTPYLGIVVVITGTGLLGVVE